MSGTCRDEHIIYCFQLYQQIYIATLAIKLPVPVPAVNRGRQVYLRTATAHYAVQMTIECACT